MPFPRWLAHVNKRVFNPIEERRGARPVLIHTGRTSGKTYRTPLDAHRLPDGYLFIPMYGPRTDWVKNAMADQQVPRGRWGDIHERDDSLILEQDARRRRAHNDAAEHTGHSSTVWRTWSPSTSIASLSRSDPVRRLA